MKSVGIDIKKIFALAIVAFAFSLVFIPSNAHAITLAQTEVTGEVTENGNGVSGADVTVTCNGKQQKDQTDADGAYRVDFKATDCPAGTTISVSATTSDGKSGTSTGTAGKITTKLNVAVVNVSVPEIGMIAGVAAMAVAGGAILYTRRRQAQF